MFKFVLLSVAAALVTTSAAMADNIVSPSDIKTQLYDKYGNCFYQDSSNQVWRANERDWFGLTKKDNAGKAICKSPEELSSRDRVKNAPEILETATGMKSYDWSAAKGARTNNKAGKEFPGKTTYTRVNDQGNVETAYTERDQRFALIDGYDENGNAKGKVTLPAGTKVVSTYKDGNHLVVHTMKTDIPQQEAAIQIKSPSAIPKSSQDIEDVEAPGVQLNGVSPSLPLLDPRIDEPKLECSVKINKNQFSKPGFKDTSLGRAYCDNIRDASCQDKILADACTPGCAAETCFNAYEAIARQLRADADVSEARSELSDLDKEYAAKRAEALKKLRTAYSNFDKKVAAERNSTKDEMGCISKDTKGTRSKLSKVLEFKKRLSTCEGEQQARPKSKGQRVASSAK